MAFLSFFNRAFSNPHNEANDPEIRASLVFGFTPNKAPELGESDKIPP